MAQLLLYLLEEKGKLFAAIRKEKAALDVDMDSEVSLNVTRQSLARIFKRMNDLRNSEQTISNGATGYDHMNVIPTQGKPKIKSQTGGKST